uniref:Hydrogenase 4, membrane subunit n=1 Tax=mine drainage metagenome TaxID=410659 RepID=E6PF60_9ZZZZ
MRGVRLLASSLLAVVAAAAIACAARPFAPFIVRSPIFARYLTLDFAATPLARPFLAFLAIGVIVVAIWNLKRGRAGAGIPLACFSAAMLGVLLAQSIFTFLLSWELMSLISIAVVATESERKSVRRATFAYALVSQLGALAMTISFAMLAVHAGSGSFAALAAAAPSLAPALRAGVLAGFFIGFGSKAGLVPLQFWLPRAHPAAPANASALLSGVMIEIALYALALGTFVLVAPVGAVAGIILLVAGLAGALFGGLYAAVESELKRLLAFSSIEHMGVMVSALGLAIAASALGFPALATVAFLAMLFHALNHTVLKTLLFLAAGTVVERMHHVTDLDRLRGLASGALKRSAPWILVGCLAAAALPPSNAFISEWLVFQGFIGATLSGNASLASVGLLGLFALLLGGGLAAAAFVKLFGIAFAGDPAPAQERETPEAFDAATIALAVAATLVLVLGIFPLLALHPLLALAAGIVGTRASSLDTMLASSVRLAWLAAIPVLVALGAWWYGRRVAERSDPVWACGSVLPARASYSATALTKPLRRIFAFALFPERRRSIDAATSIDFPTQIAYAVKTHDLTSEAARSVAAFAQRFVRRLRVVQSGRMRAYIAYAAIAVALALVLGR